KGIEKGIEQGIEQGRRSVALDLLESGLLDIEKIAEINGLAPEEVQGMIPK
ncbi:MAG: transposase, partial [Candidatus Electrothrix sp. LOE2]|nr:transposase [Candidatus Electrothrix sp. LOE2]